MQRKKRETTHTCKWSLILYLSHLIDIRVKARSHTHTHTHTHKYKFQHLASNSLRDFLNSRHVTFREHPCQVCVCVCVCVCVSMLNIGHCNCQPSDITNCTERSRREAAGRDYTENDLSITFLMAISDGGAGVVVCARAHGVSASASIIAMCKTRSDGALLGPEARIWPRSGVTWLSCAPCSSDLASAWQWLFLNLNLSGARSGHGGDLGLLVRLRLLRALAPCLLPPHVLQAANKAVLCQEPAEKRFSARPRTSRGSRNRQRPR